MDAVTEIVLGAGAGIVGKIVFDWLQRPRSTENGNGNKSGNIDAAIWRIWIKQDCRDAIKEDVSPKLTEVHDKVDRLLEHTGNNHELLERHTAILRDIREKIK